MSKYTEFLQRFENNKEQFRKDLSSDGTFSFSDQVSELITFSNKVNLNLFVYLFDEILGEHLAEKFVIDFNRNLLSFFNSVDYEIKFFILYEIKNNKSLYAYC